MLHHLPAAVRVVHRERAGVWQHTLEGVAGVEPGRQDRRRTALEHHQGGKRRAAAGGGDDA
jgi:hypothetical protein